MDVRENNIDWERSDQKIETEILKLSNSFLESLSISGERLKDDDDTETSEQMMPPRALSTSVDMADASESFNNIYPDKKTRKFLTVSVEMRDVESQSSGSQRSYSSSFDNTFTNTDNNSSLREARSHSYDLHTHLFDNGDNQNPDSNNMDMSVDQTVQLSPNHYLIEKIKIDIEDFQRQKAELDLKLHKEKEDLMKPESRKRRLLRSYDLGTQIEKEIEILKIQIREKQKELNDLLEAFDTTSLPVYSDSSINLRSRLKKAPERRWTMSEGEINKGDSWDAGSDGNIASRSFGELNINKSGLRVSGHHSHKTKKQKNDGKSKKKKGKKGKRKGKKKKKKEIGLGYSAGLRSELTNRNSGLKGLGKTTIAGTALKKSTVFKSQSYLENQIEKEMEEYHIPYRDLKFEKKIGTGAYGKVFRGRLRSNDKIVAIKRLKLRPKVKGDFKVDLDSYRELVNTAFLHEIQSMKKVFDHPFVIKLIGVSKNEKYCCIVMEYMEGGSLHDLLFENAKYVEHGLELKNLFRILRDVAEGMKNIHTLPVPLIHRDLSTHNLLLNSTNIDKARCYIGDFGIAVSKRKEVELSDSGNHMNRKPISPVGHPRYRPPEITNNTLYSKRVDVYTFGTVIYELVTGSKPFEDMDDQTVVSATAQGMLPTIPSSSKVPPPVAELMTRCWSFEPKKRPQFVEICSILDEILEGLEHPQSGVHPATHPGWLR